MIFILQPYVLIFVLGTILSYIVASIVLKRRPAPGWLPFFIFNAGATLWSFCWIMEIGSSDIPTAIFWAKLEYIGIVPSGVAWLAFTLDYNKIKWWRRPRNLILFSILPLATLCVAFTNELHGWLWSNIYYGFETIGKIIIWEHGFWFYITAFYQYALITAGIVVLWYFRRRRSREYLSQTLMLTATAVLPILANIVYLMGNGPTQRLDLTPFILGVSSLMYVLTIYRYNLFDISNTARNKTVESVPEGILVLDTDSKIVDINAATAKMSNNNKEFATGKTLSEIWPKLDTICSSLKAGRTFEFVEEKNGNTVYFEGSLTALFDKRGNQGGKLIVIQNITRRKIDQFKLEASYTKECELRVNLQEEVENRGKYTRALVHELKTPLTAILSSSELLESDLEDNLYKSLARNIRQASLNLEQRTNDLIDLACGEIGILRVEPESLDMSKLVKQIIMEMYPLAKKGGLSIESEIDDNLFVQGDKNRLSLVMTNLIGNAIKYTSKGKVTIRVHSDGLDTLLIQVEDTGRGMDKEQLMNLFDPFRRKAIGGQKYSGLGVGLALCKLYIELHKGKIWVDSARDRGSTISFSLPVYHENQVQCQMQNAVVL
jgi:PAS domain S-box-containing protein